MVNILKIIDFKKIIGQEKPIQQLKNIIKNEKIGHAYLFTGSEGIGKKLTAIAFSKAVNCDSLSEDFDPCNECPSCLKIDNSTHSDFQIISSENSVITINQIQNIKNIIYLQPLEGRKKIFLIDDAHKMTVEASNALLKILEEPPAFAVLILITDTPDNILPTIISRCNRVSFFPINRESQKEVLINMHQDLDKRLLEEIILFSSGSFGKAIELIGDLSAIKEKNNFLEWLIDTNPEQMVNKLFSSSEKELTGILNSFLDFTEVMVLWFRDILFFQLKLGPEILSFPERIDKIKEFANYYSQEKIITSLEYLTEIPEKVRKYIQPKILLENFIIQLGD